jgi:hypothetical protein
MAAPQLPIRHSRYYPTTVGLRRDSYAQTPRHVLVCAICLSTSGLDIVFKTTAELAKFMRHTHEEIPLFIAQGCVSNTTARVMEDSFTMDVPLGAYAVEFLNIPRTITAKRLLEVLGELNLQPQGFRDVTNGKGARAPIFRVGFPDIQLRYEAVLTLSGQIIPQLFRAPLRVSLATDIPRGHCFACGRKGHSARDTEKCLPTCRICHEPLVVVEDGETYDHKCVYIQEESMIRFSSNNSFRAVRGLLYLHLRPVLARTASPPLNLTL